MPAVGFGSPSRLVPLLSARISDWRVDPGRLAPASHVPCHAQPLPNLEWQPSYGAAALGCSRIGRVGESILLRPAGGT